MLVFGFKKKMAGKCTKYNIKIERGKKDPEFKDHIKDGMAPTCSVCHEKLVLCEDVFAGKCGHVLHCVCWLNWLERSSNCPECRQKTQKEELIRLFFSNFENDLSSESEGSDNGDTFKSKVHLITGIQNLLTELMSGKVGTEALVDLLGSEVQNLQSEVPTMRSCHEPIIDSLRIRVENLARKHTLLRVERSLRPDNCRILCNFRNKMAELSRRHNLHLLSTSTQVRILKKNVTDLRGYCETFGSLLSETRDFKKRCESSSATQAARIQSFTEELDYLKVRNQSLSELCGSKIQSLKSRIRQLKKDIKSERDYLGEAIDSLSKEVIDHKHKISSLRDHPVTKRDHVTSKHRFAEGTRKDESRVSNEDSVVVVTEVDLEESVIYLSSSETES